MKILDAFCDQHAPRLCKKGAKPALHSNMAAGPLQTDCVRELCTTRWENFTEPAGATH